MQDASTHKIVTFGEVMMRLSPPGHQKFSQASSLDLTFGGGEANVGISLAYFGLNACHVTRFPDSMIGQAATQYFRKHGLDTSQVSYGGRRMGSYFLEQGASHRASVVVYDREDSAFASLDPDALDWKEILKGANWFHWTGITPAIAQGTAAALARAITVANELGVRVSADVHSRSTLWQYGKLPEEVLPELIAGTDVVIASAHDLAGLYTSIQEEDDLKTITQKLKELCPRVQLVVDKDREIISASNNRIRGKMWHEGQMLYTRFYDIDLIVDRVGTGDAFAAGLIYGLLSFESKQQALDFATAACVLKHTIPGDANLVSSEEVLSLASGLSTGRIKR